jgi:hypothetical protein
MLHADTAGVRIVAVVLERERIPIGIAELGLASLVRRFVDKAGGGNESKQHVDPRTT